MESRRRRVAFALPALFVVLLVASPLAEGRRVASTTTTSSRHDSAAREAAPAPIASSAASPSRRLLALDSLIGFVFVPRSVAPAALCWLAAVFSSQVLLLCAGLNRRGRAPPFARA